MRSAATFQIISEAVGHYGSSDPSTKCCDTTKHSSVGSILWDLAYQLHQDSLICQSFDHYTVNISLFQATQMIVILAKLSCEKCTIWALLR